VFWSFISCFGSAGLNWSLLYLSWVVSKTKNVLLFVSSTIVSISFSSSSFLLCYNLEFCLFIKFSILFYCCIWRVIKNCFVLCVIRNDLIYYFVHLRCFYATIWNFVFCIKFLILFYCCIWCVIKNCFVLYVIIYYFVHLHCFYAPIEMRTILLSMF
jgi:hypothetical protein